MTEDETMQEIVMDRYTQFKANFPPIKAPRWHDDTLLIQAAVGDHNKVVCTYTKADGSRMFPEPLYVSGRVARQYKAFKMATAAGGVISVRAIPVHEFKILRINERSTHIW
jgi:hypothetical protein